MSKFSTIFKKLGTMRGFTPYPFLDLIQKNKVEMSENNNFISLLKQTLVKRIDGAYCNVSVARYNLQEVLKKPGALVFNPKLPHFKGSYFFYHP